MDRDTIIRLARQADGEEQPLGMWRMHVEDLERFAALVAAYERGECAKVCEELELRNMEANWANYIAGWSDGTDDCAAAIRNRSTHDQNDHS